MIRNTFKSVAKSNKALISLVALAVSDQKHILISCQKQQGTDLISCLNHFWSEITLEIIIWEYPSNLDLGWFSGNHSYQYKYWAEILAEKPVLCTLCNLALHFYHTPITHTYHTHHSYSWDWRSTQVQKQTCGTVSHLFGWAFSLFSAFYLVPFGFSFARVIVATTQNSP